MVKTYVVGIIDRIEQILDEESAEFSGPSFGVQWLLCRFEELLDANSYSISGADTETI